MQATPLIDFATACHLLNQSIPQWAQIMEHIERQQGHYKFPAIVDQVLKNLKAHDYPLMYEREASVGEAFFLSFMSERQLKALGGVAGLLSPEGRGQFARVLVSAPEIWGWFDSAFIFDEPMRVQIKARKEFEALPVSARLRILRGWRYIWKGFLFTFHQNLSVLVHGEKLTSLVTQAKAGDDQAFLKAIQIDNNILAEIPYFKECLQRASRNDERNFRDSIGRKLGAPPYRGKVKHKALWLTFAGLQQYGHLDSMTARQLLDLCDQLGINKEPYRIVDEKNLRKRLKEFKEFQKRGELSTL